VPVEPRPTAGDARVLDTGDASLIRSDQIRAFAVVVAARSPSNPFRKSTGWQARKTLVPGARLITTFLASLAARGATPSRSPRRRRADARRSANRSRSLQLRKQRRLLRRRPLPTTLDPRDNLDFSHRSSFWSYRTWFQRKAGSAIPAVGATRLRPDALLAAYSALGRQIGVDWSCSRPCCAATAS
jgi:hypothetical protein